MGLQFVPRVVSDVVVNGVVVELTPQERKVLDTLVAAGGEFVCADAVNKALGGVRGKHTNVLVHHLREKLTGHGLPAPIESARGKGWRWAL